MSYLLKDIYSVEFYNNFSGIAGEVVPAFDHVKFKKLIFDDNWNSKELKQRMRHTTLVLHQFLPKVFQQDAEIIENLLGKFRQNNITENTIEYMFLADYIEVFGINDYASSVKLIENLTRFTSCEFAVRPFIIKYGDKMIQQMHKWSLHENHHVRRLSSEGSRPRLPWAIALPVLKKNPHPILPILENLKTDSSEYVRRSVANNLNDIAKDNPHIVISMVQKWRGISPETDAIIKHGCRTLLKQANPEILKYYGLNDNSNIKFSNFEIRTTQVKIGNDLLFSFTIHNKSGKVKKLRLEYAVYYLLNNGKHTKKVFKISERQFQADESVNIMRKQSFRIITTRKFYKGQHKLSIIVNGQEQEILGFELTE
jgi:3-methyladenine DNA glycosylase AlkC